jgi:hypothetical protein
LDRKGEKRVTGKGKWKKRANKYSLRHKLSFLSINSILKID